MSRSYSVDKHSNSNNYSKKVTTYNNYNNYSNYNNYNNYNNYSNDYYRSEKNQGLPNLGNICFLNSAIQFLYSSSTIRETFLKEHYENESFEDNLKKIFKCIQEERTYEEKKYILAQIVKKLEELEDNYKFKTQQDCSHFLLLILNHIGEKYPNILQMFKLYYWIACENCQERYKKIEYIIFNETPICEKCKGFMKLLFISQPACIIFHKSKNTLEPYPVSTIRNESLEYKLKAKIFYSGNGSFGHYTLSRRKNVDDLKSKFYIFSDSTIYEEYQERYYKSVETPLLSLYEFQRKKEESKYKNNQFNSPLEHKDDYENEIKYPENKRIFENSETKMDVEEKKKSNKVLSFFNNLKSDTLASILITIFNVESLKSKIERVESSSEIFKLIQNYSKIKNSSNISTLLEHEKHACLNKIIEFLNEEDKDFQEFIEKYYAPNLSEYEYMDEYIEQKVYSFIKVIWFICILNSEIKQSFEWSYKKYCEQKRSFEVSSMKLFLRRYSEINCKKQIYLEKHCELLRKPRYIIIIEKEHEPIEKHLLLESKPYVDYILRSSTNSEKGGVFIKIYEIKNLKFQVDLLIPNVNKEFSIEIKDLEIKLKNILDQYESTLQRYKIDYLNIELFINLNSIEVNSSLSQKLINLINVKNGTSSINSRYSRKPIIKLFIKEKY